MRSWVINPNWWETWAPIQQSLRGERKKKIRNAMYSCGWRTHPRARAWVSSIRMSISRATRSPRPDTACIWIRKPHRESYFYCYERFVIRISMHIVDIFIAIVNVIVIVILNTFHFDVNVTGYQESKTGYCVHLDPCLHRNSWYIVDINSIIVSLLWS